MAFVSPSLRGAFARFVEGLYEEACKNVGLSHAKVREYWIYRGPKWLLMTICLISGLLAVEEALGYPMHRERMARLASGVIAMTASCIMLYFKLPDSIRCQSHAPRTISTSLRRRPSSRGDRPTCSSSQPARQMAEVTRSTRKALLLLMSRRISPPRRMMGRGLTPHRV